MNHNTIEQAYTWAYPLVGMGEYLQTQCFGQQKTSELNEFVHTASVSTPDTTFVPAPNNDTTYSRAWLDLRDGPVLITTPDTGGRFYTIHLMDMFSETIGNCGKRLYGTQAHRFLIIGPDGHNQEIEDVIPIQCKTYFAMAFLRVLIGDSSQLPQVKQLQSEFKIESINLSQKTKPPIDFIQTKTFTEFFSSANQLLQHSVLGEEFVEWKSLLQQMRSVKEEVLKPVCEHTLQLIDEGGLKFGEEINYWRIARKGIGTYGQDSFQRAVVWYKGALANVPEESLYPSTFQDEKGDYLIGIHHYSLCFEKDSLPPVSQFWSLTMYRFSDGMLCENEIKRYSIGDRSDHLVYGQDGSLTIWIQNDKPTDQDKLSNWLPAPNEKFYLTLRLYGPLSEAIQGKWNPPVVKLEVEK